MFKIKKQLKKCEIYFMMDLIVKIEVYYLKFDYYIIILYIVL